MKKKHAEENMASDKKGHKTAPPPQGQSYFQKIWHKTDRPH